MESVFEEHTVKYKLFLIFAEDVTEELKTYSDQELIAITREMLEEKELRSILYNARLISGILKYYRKYNKLSEKQRFCLCRAIAEAEYHYLEHNGYFGMGGI